MVAFDFDEYCVSICNALSARADVTLMLPFRESATADVNAAVRLVRFRKPRLRQPARQLEMVWRLRRELRLAQPDVLHVQQGHLWFNLALPFLDRPPLVVTIHDLSAHFGDRGGQNTPQAFMNIAFRRADRIIVHAEKLKEELVRGWRVAPNIVQVVPHVAIGATGAAAAPEVAEEEGLVLFFGRIWPYKGLDVLIRAEPLISASVPGAHFVIAGEGEEFSNYRALMAHPERFTVLNEFVSLEDRAALFQRASVVVLPYVEASQSGVVPVAYSFGKAVVATTVGGLPEAVDDGATGLLVPPHDEHALAEALVRLLTDRELRRRMGTAGRRKLQRDWSPHRVADQTLEVYRLAYANRSPRST
jgi:glycosyltransferase involved in cell wall biosynthesis